MIKDKTNYVANGIMTFMDALIREHFADEELVYKRVTELCQAQHDRLVSLSPSRNR
jgi:hypothetical protein